MIIVVLVRSFAVAESMPHGEFDGYGEVPGITEGATFDKLEHAKAAGVHNENQRGIAGRAQGVAAQSIVISGGYKDDEDFGDFIIYTGEGGRLKDSRRHIKDQEMTGGNATLVRSQALGTPVRVLRGANAGTEFSPTKGYRYDGLYCVESHWSDTEEDGFLIWRYALRKLSDVAVPRRPEKTPSPAARSRPGGQEAPKRRPTSTNQIVRDPEVIAWVKKEYNDECQVCCTPLELPDGTRYSETAHIRGLGYPHSGPDKVDNALCLCPNHHKLFDLGAITISEDLKVVSMNTAAVVGRLHVTEDHQINPDHLSYHRKHHRQRSPREQH
jgi:putative restriction endonuclease